jgi:hypothetical protein
MEITTRTRAELKQYFVKNAIPTEKNFAELIDAALNLREDGIVKPSGNPLSIEATGDDTSQQKVLHLYRDFDDPDPAWVLSLNPRQNPADPATARPGLSIGDAAGTSRLFIDRETGNVGVGTVAPNAKLHVSGGAIMPQHGTGLDSGICFRHTFTPDTKDAGWVRYYKLPDGRSILELGTADDPNDHIALLPSGNVGIGTIEPGAKLHVNGNACFNDKVGVGTPAPEARLTLVAPGTTPLKGSVRSQTLLITAGTLAQTKGAELALATIGFLGGHNSSLGVRAYRNANGTSWQTTAIGLGMDVDDTVRAGASLWIAASGVGVGAGATAPRGALDVPKGDVWVGQSLNVSAPSDGTNAGFLNIRNETNGRFWHITHRSGEGDKLIFFSHTGAAAIPVLKLSFDGAIELGANKPGPFVRLNDDVWFSDPQNGTIEVKNGNGTGPGTMIGNFQPFSSVDYKKDVRPLPPSDLVTLLDDALKTELVRYRYNNDEPNDRLRLGVIVEHCPEYLVGQGGKSLSMVEYVAMLHGALQVLAGRITELEGDLAGRPAHGQCSPGQSSSPERLAPAP